MESSDSTAEMEPRSGNGTKIERIIAKYGLEGIGDELERGWTGEQGSRRSLRDLAEVLNRRILDTAVESGDDGHIAADVDSLYRTLTADDVDTTTRAQVEATLDRLGVDVNEVRQDFVSHQAIHTYLTDVRSVEYSSSAGDDENPIERRSAVIQKLRSRLESVTEQSVADLREAGHLSIGSFDVITTVRVHCTDCGTTFEAGELFDGRACNCRSGDG